MLDACPFEVLLEFMVFLTIERRAISSLKVFTVAVSEKMLSKAWMLCSVTVP